MTDRAVTADREQLFATLADPATAGQFFERVSDSVSWTMEGTHPLAGAGQWVYRLNWPDRPRRQPPKRRQNEHRKQH
jgi:hypothetical protein